MNEYEILQQIDRLYDVYHVDKGFYTDLDQSGRIRAMKGILAELDLNKSKKYTAADIEIIQDIFFHCC